MRVTVVTALILAMLLAAVLLYVGPPMFATIGGS